MRGDGDDRRTENRVCRLRTMPGGTASDAWAIAPATAPGTEPATEPHRLPEENGRKHKTAWNQLKVYVLWHRERNPRPKGRLILRTKNVKECVESICLWTQRTQKRGHQEHRQPKVWTVGRKIASAASGPCPAAQRRMLGLQRYEQPEEMKFLIWTS